MRKWSMQGLGLLVVVLFAAASGKFLGSVAGPERAQAQAKKDEKKTPVVLKKKYQRGRKAPTAAQLKMYHDAAFKRHGHRMKGMPRPTASVFDCRQMGWVLPVNDQGQCGDCF